MQHHPGCAPVKDQKLHPFSRYRQGELLQCTMASAAQRPGRPTVFALYSSIA
jgi:hypothetical protein